MWREFRWLRAPRPHRSASRWRDHLVEPLVMIATALVAGLAAGTGAALYGLKSPILLWIIGGTAFILSICTSLYGS